MHKIKLLAVDLDDTLLRPDLTVSGRDARALAAAGQAGVDVVLATGRMFCSAVRIAGELGLDGPVIAYQGGLIGRTSGELMLHRPMPLALAREVITRVLPYGYHLNVYLDDRLYVERLTDEARQYAAVSGVEANAVGDLLSFVDRDPTKVLVVAGEEKLDQLVELLNPVLAPRVNINKSKPYFLEFSHPQATKGRALEYLASLLGYCREEIMAIGDGYNDLDMLEYAGIGVVMGNARPEIKECADFVTSANDRCGVAEAVEKYILGGAR